MEWGVRFYALSQTGHITRFPRDPSPTCEVQVMTLTLLLAGQLWNPSEYSGKSFVN